MSTRRITVLLIGAFAFLLLGYVDGSIHASQGTGHDGGNGRKKIAPLDSYFMMEDPLEAARRIRKDAAQTGIDLDKPLGAGMRLSTYDPSVIRLPSGEVSVNPADTSLLAEAANLQARGMGDEYIMLIIQSDGSLTWNHILALMERGIRIFTASPKRTSFARVRISEVSSVAHEPFVRWIGRYKGIYKYQRDKIYDGSRGTHVVPFDGDRPAYREDLRKLGLEIKGFSKYSRDYYVDATPDVVEKIANMWWVRRIFQLQRKTIKEPGLIQRDRRVIEQSEMVRPMVDFKPQDSRKLTSATYLSIRGGSENDDYAMPEIPEICYPRLDRKSENTGLV